MTLGQKIKDLRKEKKLSIKELANKSGLSIVSISNYENDHKKPNLLSIQKLAQALDCEYDDLFNLK